jgi:hypothetical protein
MYQRPRRFKKPLSKVLPCFNHVATGTCSFSRYCLYIHDPRIRLIHEQCNIYRNPNSLLCTAITDDTSCGRTTCCSDSSSECDIQDQSCNIQVHRRTYLRDNLFDFPVIERKAENVNAQLYEVNDNKLNEKHKMELAMWHGLIGQISRRFACNQTAKFGKRNHQRLPILKELAEREESTRAKLRMRFFRMKVLWLSLLDLTCDEKNEWFFYDGDWSFHRLETWTFNNLIEFAMSLDASRGQAAEAKHQSFLQRCNLSDNFGFETWSEFWSVYYFLSNNYKIV